MAEADSSIASLASVNARVQVRPHGAGLLIAKSARIKSGPRLMCLSRARLRSDAHCATIIGNWEGPSGESRLAIIVARGSHQSVRKMTRVAGGSTMFGLGGLKDTMSALGIDREGTESNMLKRYNLLRRAIHLLDGFIKNANDGNPNETKFRAPSVFFAMAVPRFKGGTIEEFISQCHKLTKEVSDRLFKEKHELSRQEVEELNKTLDVISFIFEGAIEYYGACLGLEGKDSSAGLTRRFTFKEPGLSGPVSR